MSQTKVLTGANVKVYISGALYAEVQNLTYTINYADTEIYGIDSPFAQEIAPGRVSVQGSISGVRVKFTGGLQGHNIRTKINEILHSPYTSLRIKDRHSDVDLLWLPQMKVTAETMTIPAKGTVKLNFTFKGIIPYNPLDMN